MNNKEILVVDVSVEVPASLGAHEFHEIPRIGELIDLTQDGTPAVFRVESLIHRPGSHFRAEMYVTRIAGFSSVPQYLRQVASAS